MMKNKKRTSYWKIMGLLVLFISISFYYFNTLEGRAYLGLQVDKRDEHWVIRKVRSKDFYDDLLADDEILSVDGEAANDNQMLTRYLIVENISSLTIRRNGQKMTKNIPKDSLSRYQFGIFWIIGTFFLLSAYIVSKYRK